MRRGAGSKTPYGDRSHAASVVKFLRVRIKICVQLKFADQVMEAL